MPTLQQLETALRNADAAGDTAAATALAREYARMRNEQPKSGGGDPSRWSVFNEAMDTLTMGGQMKANAALGGLADATMGAVQGQGWNWSDNYNKQLEAQRADQAAFQEQSPVRSGIGTGAGIALGVAKAPFIGSGWGGAAKTGLAYGAAGGALQDANSIPERLTNTVSGGALGAGIGLGGYGAGKLAAGGLSRLSQALDSMGAPPDVRAATKVGQIADERFGPNNAMALNKALNDLGPDAAIVDVLGEQGRSLARSAGNINPMARETTEGFALGRKAGQNNRVVSDMEKIAGLPQGSTKTVDDLIEVVDKKFRPTIDALYDQARKAGKDMPLEYFDDVLKTAQGKSVYQQARQNVQARAKLSGTEVSNLAVVDEMKKVFDSRAKVAYQKGDRASGSLYKEFAYNLKTRADAIMDQMEDPIYKQARAAAQQMKQAQDAIRMGEELGASRVPTNLPGKAEGMDLGNRKRMAQGYVAKKSDTLLNRGSTEGAINEMATPMGRKAADAALGAGNVDKTLSRERTFNQTAKAITGNSTTARQLQEMGMTGSDAMATALAMGYDATTGGIAGLIGRGLKKGSSALARSLSTEAQRKAAPIIAEILTKAEMPVSGATARGPAALERLSKADRGKLVKALLFSMPQNTKPQTAFEKK